MVAAGSRDPAVLLIRIERQLSFPLRLGAEGAALLPSVVIFSIDREERNERDIGPPTTAPLSLARREK
jgi:hypothetical protein